MGTTFVQNTPEIIVTSSAEERFSIEISEPVCDCSIARHEVPALVQTQS